MNSPEAGLSATERLVDVFRQLDRAGSLTEILDTLADSAGRESARSGLLMLRHGDLHGWRFTGFGPAFEAAPAVALPLEASGILAEAVRAGSATFSSTSIPAGPAGPAAPPFAAPAFAALPDGRERFAMPLMMKGEVVAVLYADQGTGDEPGLQAPEPTWPGALELIVRHAARCLEAATALTGIRVLVHEELTRALGGGGDETLLRETA